MTDNIYERTLLEIADDLGINAQFLHEKFGIYITKPEQLETQEVAFCYALYRVIKIRQGMDMMRRSRELWRERAYAEGWIGSEDNDPINEMKAEE